MAVGMTPLLAGCFNPLQAAVDQVAEDAAQNAAEDIFGGDVDLNLDGEGASMPDDWPGEIPVIPGTIESSMRLGSGDSLSWSVTITVDNEAEAWAAIKSDFDGAGFVTDFESVDSDGSMGSFSNGTYSAIVSVTDDGSGGLSATYIVSLMSAE
jgi:hypothetical protein